MEKRQKLNDLHVEGELLTLPKKEKENIYSFDISFPNKNIKVVAYEEDILHLQLQLHDKVLVVGPCAFDTNNNLICGANVIIPLKDTNVIYPSNITKKEDLELTKNEEVTNISDILSSEEENHKDEIFLNSGIIVEDLQSKNVVNNTNINNKSNVEKNNTQNDTQKAFNTIDKKLQNDNSLFNNEFGIPMPNQISLFAKNNVVSEQPEKKVVSNDVSKVKDNNKCNSNNHKRNGKFTLEDLES